MGSEGSRAVNLGSTNTETPRQETVSGDFLELSNLVEIAEKGHCGTSVRFHAKTPSRRDAIFLAGRAIERSENEEISNSFDWPGLYLWP